MFQNEDLILENLKIPFCQYKSGKEEKFINNKYILYEEENINILGTEKFSDSTRMDVLNDLTDSLSVNSYHNHNEQNLFSIDDFNLNININKKYINKDDLFFSERNILPNDNQKLNKFELFKPIIILEKKKNSSILTFRKSSIIEQAKQIELKNKKNIIQKKIVKDKKREIIFKKIKKIKNFWNKNQKSLLQIFLLNKNENRNNLKKNHKNYKFLLNKTYNTRKRILN